MSRITLIHAVEVAIAPIRAAFVELWPEAVLANVLDDSLSPDRAREAELTPAISDRIRDLGAYAVRSGADGVLYTCSAFGPPIEACARDLAPMPVLKPNEAMIEEAVTKGTRIGLLVTFPGTIPSMTPEFPAGITVVPKVAEGALAALDAGDVATHDRLATEAAKDLADCDAIALGYGLKPETQLADLAGTEFAYDPDFRLFLPKIDGFGRALDETHAALKVEGVA